MKENTSVKKNIIKIVAFVALFAIFVIIFRFSNQDSEKSTGLSRSITEEITENIEAVQKLDEVEKENVLLKTEVVIRKLAHFSLYTLVGIAAMSLMLTYDNIDMKRKIIYSFCIGVVYACSDEFHQLFIYGRSAEILDIIIDACGVAVGIGIVMLIRYVWKKLQTKKVNANFDSVSSSSG